MTKMSLNSLHRQCTGAPQHSRVDQSNGGSELSRGSRGSQRGKEGEQP
uniref:Uncharacterized protein n=1 Tax=Anguilla anguilla TaxID=7936 RepID=A0A0E9TPT3_ANGAN